MEKEAHTDVTLNDITAFVTARARAATHPIFGKIANESKGKPLISKAMSGTGSENSLLCRVVLSLVIKIEHCNGVTVENI